jgi:2-polyprenyl-3-methyl-5-hydroxy-6-metoxy-1,4-benzoquinol methylase
MSQFYKRSLILVVIDKYTVIRLRPIFPGRKKMYKDEQENYRTRIYRQYGTNFQDAPKLFVKKETLRWAHGYEFYLRNWLPKDKAAVITDVGCGGGKLLFFFINLGFLNVTGVDISPEQVSLAKQITPSVEEANALDWLEAHPNSLDLITGLDIIEHLHKQEVLRFLDACFNALKPGGRLVLQTPNAESPWGSQHIYNDFTHEVGFNPNLLSRMLHLSGFEHVEARETGPVPWGHSIFSSLRFIIWQMIRLGLIIWNLAETGTAGSGVFTRVFLITGTRR